MSDDNKKQPSPYSDQGVSFAQAVPHHERYLQRDSVYAKARDRGQPVFTLVGQDDSASEVVVEWIRRNIRTAPQGKLYEALTVAIQMRDYPHKKLAD